MKASVYNAGDLGWRPGFDPWVGKIPWRRAWQPTPAFWHGDPHGQKSLAGYSLWGHKELDTTEQLSTAQRRTQWNYCQCLVIRRGDKVKKKKIRHKGGQRRKDDWATEPTF